MPWERGAMVSARMRSLPWRRQHWGGLAVVVSFSWAVACGTDEPISVGSTTDGAGAQAAVTSSATAGSVGGAGGETGHGGAAGAGDGGSSAGGATTATTTATGNSSTT